VPLPSCPLPPPPPPPPFHWPQVVRLGFDRTKLVESIRTRQQNEATVTYWLLLDNRRRLPSSGYLAHELSEAVAAASAGYLGGSAGALGVPQSL
jgi:5'-AMP-activated protein kinase catalytic alpha subunit